MIRALLYETNEEMVENFGDIKELHTTLEKDITKSYQEAILEIYRKLKPGDPATVESGKVYYIIYFSIQEDMILQKLVDINLIRN